METFVTDSQMIVQSIELNASRTNDLCFLNSKDFLIAEFTREKAGECRMAGDRTRIILSRVLWGIVSEVSSPSHRPCTAPGILGGPIYRDAEGNPLGSFLANWGSQRSGCESSARPGARHWIESGGSDLVVFFSNRRDDKAGWFSGRGVSQRM